MSNEHDDVVSEIGGEDEFVAGAASRAGTTTGAPHGAGHSRVGVGAADRFTRAGPESTGWGRGPVPVDRRKFKYDVNAALRQPMLSFTATKVDRLDAGVAGDYLDRIHKAFAIHNVLETRLYAFDQALWYEHAVNGGSILQASRGVMTVDKVEFDIPVIMKILGVDARRFFRAYADQIAICLRGVLERYTPYDPVASEMYAAVMQVAVARGLQKYPHLIHDSSDAGMDLSIEERVALQSSKRVVIASTVNAADTIVGRVGNNAGYGSSAAVHVED